MKLTRTLKISEQEFYDYLEREFITNVHNCSTKEITTCDIRKGLKYSEHEDIENARVDVEILEYERGKVFRYQMNTLTDIVEISYETSEEQTGLQVVFTQNIDSFKHKKKHGIVHFFSEGIYLGRMSDTLYGIQNKILKERETI